MNRDSQFFKANHTAPQTPTEVKRDAWERTLRYWKFRENELARERPKTRAGINELQTVLFHVGLEIQKTKKMLEGFAI